MTQLWTSKDDPRDTLKASEDPRKAKYVHAWFYKAGKVFNQCVINSRWVIENYTLEKR
jgi:hypothetical protein